MCPDIAGSRICGIALFLLISKKIQKSPTNAGNKILISNTIVETPALIFREKLLPL